MRVVVALHTAELAYLRSIAKGILDLLFRQTEREADGIPLALDKTLVPVRILQLGSEHELVPAGIVAFRGAKAAILTCGILIAVFINHPFVFPFIVARCSILVCAYHLKVFVDILFISLLRIVQYGIMTGLCFELGKFHGLALTWPIIGIAISVLVRLKCL